MAKFTINPQVDLPIANAKLLNHKIVVDNLTKFLTSDNLIAPLSIALHGEWGSGKTSVISTVSQNLQTNTNNLVTYFFEAWKWESGDPATALVSSILLSIVTKPTLANTAKKVMRLIGQTLSKKYLDMEWNEIEKMFSRDIKEVENLTGTFQNLLAQQLGDKKVIVFIDDLDRCSPENAIKILSIMKLFLNANNCIFVAAVDFNKLKRAWSMTYGGGDDANKEGELYLEKIFQIRIGLPHPTVEELKTYLESLTKKVPPDLLHLMATLGPPNPREIKRMLNLIAYRSMLLGNDELAQLLSTLWTLLEEILGREGAAKFVSIFKTPQGFLEHIFTHGNKWSEYKNRFDDKLMFVPDAEKRSMGLGLLRTFVANTRTILMGSGDVEKIYESFNILYRSSNEIVKLSK